MLWPNMYLRLRITHCIGAEEPALHTARAAVIFLSKMETGKYTVMIRSAKKKDSGVILEIITIVKYKVKKMRMNVKRN